MNKEYLELILENNREKFINEGLDIIDVEDLEDFIEDLVIVPMEKEFDITIDFNKLFNIKKEKKEDDIENVLY